VARGRRVTTYHTEIEALAARGDTGPVEAGARWVHDGKVVTAAGVSAGIDMSLWLLGELRDPDFARLVRRWIAYDPAPPYRPAGPSRCLAHPGRDRGGAAEPLPPGVFNEWRNCPEALPLVRLRRPALQLRRLPVGAHRRRALRPRAELRLRELRVDRLQLDAVRVPRLEVLQEHLARDLVALVGVVRQVEVELEERVRVRVEDGRDAVLLQQLDVLEPVDVAARRAREEVDVGRHRAVLLVRVPSAGQVLGVDPDGLVGLAVDVLELVSHRRLLIRGLRQRRGRGVDEVLLDHALDPGQRPLLGDAGDVARAGQRHLRHRRRLDRQRGEVRRPEGVDVGLAAGARQHLHLERERVQEVVDALRGVLDDEPLAELGILRRDADRAAPGVAVVALAGRDADGALVVG